MRSCVTEPRPQGSVPGAIRVFPLLLATVLAAAAQSEKPASISGQVLNALTGEPVRKAMVVVRPATGVGGRARSQGGRGGYSTTTDRDGRFSMSDLAAGTYRVTALRAGFVASEYGSRAPGRPGTPVTLADGQNMADTAIRMTPQGVITGRILDEDGDPVRGASVQALRYRYGAGGRQLGQSGGTNTNDLGEYRLYDLPPGKYFVSAMYRQQAVMRGTEDRSANAHTQEDYVPTYFPGTMDSVAATQVDVAPGAQIRNIDIPLVKAHTVRIRGRITDAAAAPEYQVMLLSPDGRASRSAARSNKGEFEITGALPGSYTLVALAMRANRGRSGRVPIQVGHANIDDVTIAVVDGVTVTGHMRVEGASAPAFDNLRIALQPFALENFVSFGPQPGSTISADGSFKLADVAADRYRVVSGLPDGCYIKSIRSGSTDVLASGLDVNGTPPAPLEIVLSPKAAQITGIVQNPSTQQPAAAVLVILLPQKADPRITGGYRSVMTDASGRFTFSSLVPGDYKLYAWEDVEEGAWLDPEFMKAYEGKGEAVSVSEGGREDIRTTLIPPG